MAKKSNLRVLYLQTFPLYGSGSGTYARYLAEEVSRFAHTAIVCPDKRKIPGVKTYYLKLPFKVAFTGHPEWKNCKLYRNIDTFELLRIYKAFLNSSVEVVADFKPNIIHVHHAFPFSWAARFIKSTYQLPYIITVHGSELHTAKKDQRYIALTIDALRKARRIVPNSFYTKEWMLKMFGDEYRRQIRVIPGGVDINKFKKVPTIEIDQKYNLKGKKVVLFAGKLTPYKGVEYLVKAAKWIHGEVLIAGDGSERKKLEEMTKQQKITNVRFLGHLGNNEKLLVQLYSRANVFVAPSTWDEPLGLVILEAMACETTVVVTKKGGIPLAVKEGKNGLFIKARSVMDIVKKVNILLDDDDKRQKMARNAREIAVSQFSWQIIAQKFLKMYELFANFNKKI